MLSDVQLARHRLPDGVELHLLEQGAGEAVLLLHGGLGDCFSWRAQMDALAPRFRAIACSRRLHFPNRNPAPAGTHPIDTDVADLESLLKLLGLARAHLVGTSYGALVALAFALGRPQQVASLVLAEPPLHGWARRTAQGEALHANFMADVWHPARRAFDDGRDFNAVQRLLDGIWGRAVFASLPTERVDVALRNARGMRAITRTSDPFPDLPCAAVAGLRMPTLLVRGEHASPLHRLVVDELALAMPAAAQAVIAGAGHGSPQENAFGFNAAMLGFLVRQSAGA